MSSSPTSSAHTDRNEDPTVGSIDPYEVEDDEEEEEEEEEDDDELSSTTTESSSLYLQQSTGPSNGVESTSSAVSSSQSSQHQHPHHHQQPFKHILAQKYAAESTTSSSDLQPTNPLGHHTTSSHFYVGEYSQHHLVSSSSSNGHSISISSYESGPSSHHHHNHHHNHQQQAALLEQCRVESSENSFEGEDSPDEEPHLQLHHHHQYISPPPPPPPPLPPPSSSSSSSSGSLIPPIVVPAPDPISSAPAATISSHTSHLHFPEDDPIGQPEAQSSNNNNNNLRHAAAAAAAAVAEMEMPPPTPGAMVSSDVSSTTANIPSSVRGIVEDPDNESPYDESHHGDDIDSTTTNEPTSHPEFHSSPSVDDVYHEASSQMVAPYYTEPPAGHPHGLQPPIHMYHLDQHQEQVNQQDYQQHHPFNFSQSHHQPQHQHQHQHQVVEHMEEMDHQHLPPEAHHIENEHFIPGAPDDEDDDALQQVHQQELVHHEYHQMHEVDARRVVEVEEEEEDEEEEQEEEEEMHPSHHHHHPHHQDPRSGVEVLDQPQGQEIVISDVPVQSRARASLPASYLYVDQVVAAHCSPEVVSTESGGGVYVNGVFARKSIPQRTLFGPVEGVILESNVNKSRRQPNLIVYISESLILDQSDENTSNWMTFVRMASSSGEQNLILVTKEQTQPNPENPNELITTTKFYFMTTKPINACEELKVWYSKEYAERFRLKLLDEETISPSLPSSHHDDDQIEDQVLSLTHHHQSHQELSPALVVTTPTDEKKAIAAAVGPGIQQETTCAAPTTVWASSSGEQNLILVTKEQTHQPNPTGHKLRNKIAKTQQQQHLQLQKQQMEETPVGPTLSAIHPQLLPEGAEVSEMGEPEEGAPDTSPEEESPPMDVSLSAGVSTDAAAAANNINSIRAPEAASTGKAGPAAAAPQYRCDICQKGFPRFYSLRRHQIMHSGEKKYKCPICGMAFSHVYNRNRHVKRHSKGCFGHKRPTISMGLNRGNHTTQNGVHNKDNLGHQATMTTRLKSQQQHLHAIHEEDPNQEQVSTTSQSGGGERQPLPVARKSSPSGAENNTTNGLLIDAKKQVNPAAKPFRCQQCYKSFTTDDRLLKHAIVHSDEQVKPLACHFCEKRFLNNSALSCHLKIHSTPKDQPRRYDCVICKEWFDCTHTRKDHVQSHAHPLTGHFTCPSCNKPFDEFSAVRKHIRAFHSEKQYPCVLCEKVFPRPDKLKLHMLRHSDHREFLCQSCGKQFKRKDKLKEHMQRMHSPNREAKLAAKQAAKQAQQMNSHHKKFVPKVSPTDYHRFIYKCHKCLLGFKRRGMLVNHLAKRHPEVPPETVPELNLPILKTTRDYYCQYCDKIYKSSSKRKAHILKNHPGKSLPLSNRHKGGIPVIPGQPNPTYSATVGSVTTHPHHCDWGAGNDWCHKQYASKAKLLQHQRKKHHGDKMSLSLGSSLRPRVRSMGSSEVDSPEERSSEGTREVTVQNPTPMTPTTTLTSLTNAVAGIGATDDGTLAPSISASPSVSVTTTPVNSNGHPMPMGSTNLITILGTMGNIGSVNLNNLNSIIATVSSSDLGSSTATDLHDLLQANPSALANDLLTQAMTELTQGSKDPNGEEFFLGFSSEPIK